MTTSTDVPLSGRPRAVVLLSGGLDSATTLAIAIDEGFETYAITFNYRQRHDIELTAAANIAAGLGVKRHLIVNLDMREIGGSALTSDIAVPKQTAADEATRICDASGPAASAIPVTYVPARNTIFLSFGLAWAEVLSAPCIFIGANEMDYSGYPDCRPQYLAAFEHMANLATKAAVEGSVRFIVKAPLISMKKSEIIKKGVSLGLDYSLTWSCYDPLPAPSGDKKEAGLSGYLPCGGCDSCRIRKKGFSEAGMTDPLVKLYNSNAL